MTLTCLRAIDDHAEFVSYPESVQTKVINLLAWMLSMDEAKAHGAKKGILKAAANALNVTEASINRYYARYRNSGWRGLIDGRSSAASEKGLPEAFKAFVASLHLQNQRATTGREVHRMVCERWSKWKRTGDPQWTIPGYPTPPPAGPKGYPNGWSEDNILRLRPDAYALATVRQGAKSGADFLPSILKTRSGMKFGQVVFFDDQDYDNKIVAPGFSQRALRPQGFNALEYLSAAFTEYVIRMRWWDTSAEHYRTLTGVEATWFIVTYLMRQGYRTDTGTTLVVEHGTMNGFDNKKLSTPDGHHSLEDALFAISNGKIKTERSGLFNSPAFAGMLFRPQSSGNPNFKAPLEGIFNLVRNRFAALPGATGRNRDLKPSEQYGMDLYAEQMLKVWDRLDDRHKAMMRFPMLNIAQFGDAAAAVYQAINSRRDHALQGWEDCGFKVPLFRFGPDDRSAWLSQQELAEMLEAKPELIPAVDALMTLPGHTQPVSLAPMEVADLHRSELTKMPDHCVSLVIPTEWAKEVTVKSDRTIIIKDQLLHSESLQYTARFEHRDGAYTLKPGMRLRAYLNPHMPERLIIHREDGSFLGALLQTNRAGFLDQDAIMGQLHERAELKADLDVAVRPHLMGLMQDRKEMKDTNDRLENGRAATPEEIADARSEAAQRGASTRRRNGWLEDINEESGNAAAEALKPDGNAPAAIAETDIAHWLND